MEFTDGIDIGVLSVEFGSRYTSVAINELRVWTDGKDVGIPTNEYGTSYTSISLIGIYLYSNGKDVGIVGNDLGLDFVAPPYIPSVFSPGVKVADYYSRLLRPGDTGIDISMLNLKRQSGKILSIY